MFICVTRLFIRDGGDLNAFLNFYTNLQIRLTFIIYSLAMDGGGAISPLPPLDYILAYMHILAQRINF